MDNIDERQGTAEHGVSCRRQSTQILNWSMLTVDEIEQYERN